MKTHEPQFGKERPHTRSPVGSRADWSRVNCTKFNPAEDISRTLCRIRAEEVPAIGLVDCLECVNRPEDLS